ncbi:hypothetical protein TSAR_007614 [Trichomalopsis sarcophagae]|uniref:N-acetyltransferase domain-containing protein n=1 Tax=Trichomalopsis sarcophagae TaxID=543379 RepID=A0A232F392_9HYME|nr:hypothetical protein TSAR_007614 [Trichomalopsis sarcophagae]
MPKSKQKQKQHQSLSAYVKWLENQVRSFRKANILLCRSLDLMKDPRYNLVPLHKRPDLIQQCCKLLNSEWKRSETARLKSLIVSCDGLPTCLLLIFDNDVLGHCKVSLVHGTIDSVIIESFVIDPAYRAKGYGSLFLGSIEEYMVENYDIKNIYLMTKGQEGFYLKNGYTVCEPSEQLNNRYRDLGSDLYDSGDEENLKDTKSTAKDTIDNAFKQRENNLLGTGTKPKTKSFVDNNSKLKDIKFVETGTIPKIRSIFEKDSNFKAKDIKSTGPPPPPMPNLKKTSVPICLTISTRTFMKKTLQA